jgi:hypothetical protein
LRRRDSAENRWRIINVHRLAQTFPGERLTSGIIGRVGGDNLYNVTAIGQSCPSISEMSFH